MKPWHWVIKADKTRIIDMVEYFDAELEEARKEVKQVGVIETIAAKLPSYLENRFGQLQQLESVMEVLEIEMRQVQAEKFKHFLEHYKRQLSSSDCKKYVDGDKDVVELSELINEVAYLRNQYLGIIKSLDMKAFQLNNIVKLRTMGIEDAKID